METLSKKIAHELSLSLHYSADKESVLAYGLTAMFQFISIFLIISIIGIIGGFYLESIIICLGVGYLRKSAGGTHASSMKACITISCFSISLLGLISSHLLIFSERLYWVVFYSIWYLVFLFIIYKKAPLDSINKRITSVQKISRLRRECFIKLLLYYGITLGLTFYASIAPDIQKLANAFFLTSLWECFTLVKPGIYIMNKLDYFFFKFKTV